MAYCQECGNELEDDEKFCSNCGTKVDEFELNKSDDTNKTKPQKTESNETNKTNPEIIESNEFKQEETKQKTIETKSNKSSAISFIENNKVLVVCICIVLIVISSVAYIFISDYLNVVNNTDVVTYEKYPDIDKSVIDRFNAYDANSDGRWNSEEFDNYLDDYSPLTDQPGFNSITFQLGYFGHQTVGGVSAMDITDFNRFNDMDMKNMEEYHLSYKKPI